MRTDARKANEKAHKKANRKLPTLLQEHRNLCYWCGIPLVLLRSLPASSIIRTTANTVTWREGETVYKRCIATTDHLLPVSEGGTAENTNLVPACPSCNRDRTSTPYVSKECRDCGAEVEVKGRKYCIVCREKRFEQFYAEDYVPLEERRRTGGGRYIGGQDQI